MLTVLARALAKTLSPFLERCSRGLRRPVPAALLVLTLNLLIAGRLFEIEYSVWVFNNEASFMAIARALKDHPHDLLWWPWWDAGAPFQNTYSPLIPFLAAAVSGIMRVSVARGLHIVAAALYCTGPVALYAALRRVSGQPRESLVAAILYSIVSPCAFLIPAIGMDMQGLLHVRRLHVLMYYGEVPQCSSLTFLPLAVLLFFQLFKAPTLTRMITASAFAAITALTNAFGAVSLVSAIILLLITSETQRFARNVLAAACALGLTVAAISPLIPWELLLAIWKNSPVTSGDFRFTGRSLAAVCGLAGLMAAVWRATRRRWPAELCFLCLFFTLMLTIVASGYFFAAWILPQPHRYQNVADMAGVSLAAFATCRCLDRFSPMRRNMLYAAGVVLIGAQTLHVVHWSMRMIRDVRIDETSSYRIALWLRDHLPGDRVMISGAHAYLANVLDDIPQLSGGHEPFQPNYRAVGASYMVYGAPAPVAVQWLRAFGTRAVTVPRAGSSEYFKPFTDPDKFEGVLPVLWQDQGNTIYSVPTKSPSLAHAVPAEFLVPFGSDPAKDARLVFRYVAAIEESPPALVQWLSRHQIRIETPVQRGQVISVQVNYVAGWQAQVDGHDAIVRPDGLGLLVVESDCTGACTVQLVFEGPTGVQTAKVVSGIAVAGSLAAVAIGVLGWLRRVWRRSQ
jgi:hypothetical protein